MGNGSIVNVFGCARGVYINCPMRALPVNNLQSTVKYISFFSSCRISDKVVCDIPYSFHTYSILGVKE